jgi:hypothetical protein
MVSIADLAPAGEDVTVNGKTITVKGLSFDQMVELYARSPDALALMGGEAKGLAAVRKFPAVAAEIVALALGLTETDAAAQVRQWPAGIIADLLLVVIRATAPRGLGPFVELMEAAADAVPDHIKSQLTPAPATTSPPPP